MKDISKAAKYATLGLIVFTAINNIKRFGTISGDELVQKIGKSIKEHTK